jgi:hypothetical protein
MKMRTSPFAVVLVVALACAGASLWTGGIVWAQVGGHPPAHESARAGISMDQAVRMAEQRFKARVVRAQSQQSGGRTVYVLRLLNESGRVWTVRVDASNGAVF